MKFTNYALIVLLSALATSVNAYTVYKSVGAYGEIKYSQTPPKEGSYETIEFRSDGRINTPGQSAPQAIDSNTQNAQSQTTQMQQQIEELQNQQTQAHCQSLRSTLANLQIGGRVYELDDNNNRVYLNDQEMKVRQERTQAALAQFCQ